MGQPNGRPELEVTTAKNGHLWEVSSHIYGPSDGASLQGNRHGLPAAQPFPVHYYENVVYGLTRRHDKAVFWDEIKIENASLIGASIGIM